MKPLLINISGSSGVGKSTVAKIIVLILSTLNKTVLHLCGDDLHKWERTNINWKRFTHLNPKANNLDLGKEQLLTLLNGSSIQRDYYNHDTGKFIPNNKIDPVDVIVNEGLHALYDSDICKLADLNVFVDTDTKLITEWKMSRDVKSRGYTKEQVLSAIKSRKEDDEKYIRPQIKNADVVIDFSKEQYGSVELNYKVVTNRGNHLMKKLKTFYDFHKNFLIACKILSFEYDLIQGAGGNLSYKFNDKIIITSSGYTMSDVSMLNGYSVCNLDSVPINKKQKRPSMEIDLHTNAKYPIVLHTHPIYLNTILCSQNGKEIIKNILDTYEYIPYRSPGKDLAAIFKDLPKSKTILLENHGLVCCGKTFMEVMYNSLKINKLCKDWLVRNTNIFSTYTTKFKTPEHNNFLYPDAVVLPEENNSINNYMLHIQKEVGLTPKYLTSKEIESLKNMEAEKYRRSLV